MAASGLIYGFHAVTSRLRAHPDSVLEVIVDAAREDARAAGLRRLAEAHGVRVRAVSRERLDGLMHGTRHQGVVARVTGIAQAHSIDELLDALRVPPLLLVLDGVTDPHNLGACLRVADAAGAHAVIAPKDRAAGLGGTAAKVASGAAETVPYLTVTNLSRALDDLKARDVWVIGADAEATEDLFTAELPEAVAWVLGAEGHGMRRLTRERCDRLVRIPMYGTVESLNVAVAAGLCLFEARRRRPQR
ncbi:MAG: 23S rRNA (guanosine(2251)-2'-O)-methyltransferase RlmB [Burkholderiales bacterium]|nr:23S rRNA (guanosine(2251)-2'-O)-methyltransferase RlmB [Burkholderiales bacterium]